MADIVYSYVRVVKEYLNSGSYINPHSNEVIIQVGEPFYEMGSQYIYVTYGQPVNIKLQFEAELDNFKRQTYNEIYNQK